VRPFLAAQSRAVTLAEGVRSRTAPRARTWLAAEVLAVGGLLIIAALARLPQLLAIPAFTDEVEEIALGLAILRDGLRPLTNVDPYIGPLWNYTLAGLFWLLGPSITIPRALVLTTGVLTVLLTYLLGRVWYGRRVGLLGATLLGASAAHTAVNSHIAWSNCVTPVFTTAGLLVLAYALRDKRPRLLPWAGLLPGLAFHTHPTAVPILAAAGLAVLLSQRRWLAGPWPYLAGLGGVAANTNLIVYNLMTNGRTFRYAQEIQSSYEREVGESTGYLSRMGDLLVGLARALGSALDQRDSLLAYATDPLILVAMALLLGGLVLTVRHRTWLPVLAVASSILILPLVNPKYDPILEVRYLAPILPVCVLWIGLALEWLGWRHRDDLRRPVSRVRSKLDALAELATGTGGVVLAALLMTGLVVGSLAALARYYDDVRENYRTGARILEVVATARQKGTAALPVVLDQRLEKMSLGPGAGIVLRVLHLALDLDGVPSKVEWLGEQRPRDVRAGQLVVLAARSKPQFTAEAVTGLGLRATNGGSPRVHSQASRYGLYQFGPETAATPAGKGGAADAPSASKGSTTAVPGKTAGARASTSAARSTRAGH
jgi:4-amino-4-deoxy-L-arabinose transferase-like glycosyltransferase